MKIVRLTNKQGEITTKYVGYSFYFLFFGPIYLIVRLCIIYAILLLIFYYYLLPIPGMVEAANYLKSILPERPGEIISSFLLFFRGQYSQYFGITIAVLTQIYFAFSVEGYLCKKMMKKHQLLPITETDARILIDVHAAKVDVLLANEAFSSNKSVPSYLKKRNLPYLFDDNEKNQIEKIREEEINLKIRKIQNLYQLGQLKKEEYELQRAKLIKSLKG